MKKFLKKVLSCAIALVLVSASAVALKAAPVKAATTGVTFYYNNSTLKMASPSWYAYDPTNTASLQNNISDAWPGNAMKDLGNGWFSFTYTGTSTNFVAQIVDGQNDKIKTSNLTSTGASAYYLVPNGKTTPADFGAATNDCDVTNTPPAGFPITFYFNNNTVKMATPCFYAIDPAKTGFGNNVSSAWPGDAMKDLGNGWFSFTYTGTTQAIKVEIVDSASTNQSLKTTFAAVDCTSNVYYIEPDGTTDDSDAFAGTTQNVKLSTAAPADFPADLLPAPTPAPTPASASSSDAATKSNSSKTSNTEAKVANPKTGNATPVAAGSIIVLASVAVLSAVIAKKKSK